MGSIDHRCASRITPLVCIVTREAFSRFIASFSRFDLQLVFVVAVVVVAVVVDWLIPSKPVADDVTEPPKMTSVHSMSLIHFVSIDLIIKQLRAPLQNFPENSFIRDFKL